MISVQSPLQLLSGNKFLLAIIVFSALCFSACKTQEKSGKTDITDTRIDEFSEEEIEEIVEETPSTAPSKSDSFEIKESYNIAYVLPFYFDSLSIDSLRENEHYFYKDAKMASEFYLGSKLALDSLAKLGFSANVHVFDSENSLGKLVELKKSGALDSMDLIIGPIYNSNVRYLAKWAKSKGIILVNPLSPTADLANENPKFIQMNASISTHILNLFELIRDKYATENKIIINRPIKNELEYQNLWKQMAEQHNAKSNSIKKEVEFPKEVVDSIKFKYLVLDESYDRVLRETRLSEDSSFVQMLKEDTLNVLIVNTIDRAYISRLNINLFKLSSKYKILVIGLPVWSTIENFRLDYVQEFNLNYSSDYFIDSSFYHSELYNYVVETYSMLPDLYFIKGYDISMWMGLNLMDFGLDMATAAINKERVGIHNNFKLGYNTEAILDSTNKLNYLENKHVQLLNIKDYIIRNVRK